MIYSVNTLCPRNYQPNKHDVKRMASKGFLVEKKIKNCDRIKKQKL